MNVACDVTFSYVFCLLVPGKLEPHRQLCRDGVGILEGENAVLVTKYLELLALVVCLAPPGAECC